MSWDVYSKLAPDTPEKAREAETIQGKRKHIYELAYHDALVRRVLDMARHEGLSGEDTMTTLAYYALIEKERMTDAYLDNAMRSPGPIYTTSTFSPEGWFNPGGKVKE
jgi:hypothetical protein